MVDTLSFYAQRIENDHNNGKNKNNKEKGKKGKKGLENAQLSHTSRSPIAMGKLDSGFKIICKVEISMWLNWASSKLRSSIFRKWIMIQVIKTKIKKTVAKKIQVSPTLSMKVLGCQK